jgi:hypothetical protein
MSNETDAGGPEAVASAAKQPGPKQSKPKMKRAGVVVEHRSLGRTRVRLSKEHRTPEKMAAIQEQLSQHPDVQSVEINQRTGSVLIKHSHERDGHEVLKETFGGVEVLAGLLLEVPIGEDEEKDGGGGEYGKLDQTLADLVYRGDKWVYKKTGLRLRGQIIAGSIAALGVAQIAITGIGLELLPGPVLLYIAYDIYHRESKEPPLDAPDEVAAPTTGDSSAPAAARPMAATA